MSSTTEPYCINVRAQPRKRHAEAGEFLKTPIAHRVRFPLVVLCLLALSGGGAMAVESRTVLVLYSNGRLVPGNVAVEAGLRSALESSAERPVTVFTEFLDNPDFTGDRYERTVTTYLRDKYADHPPSVVVAVARESLDFVLRHREDLFPDVPVVHAAVFPSFPEPMEKLPADVVGVPVGYEITGTIDQALRWHPNTQRLVFVTGSTPRDLEWEGRFRDKATGLPPQVKAEFFAGLPIEVLGKRLAELDAHSLVVTAGFYQSGDAQRFTPRDAAALVAEKSSVPVYGTFSTFLGTGVVGGVMPRFEAMGRQAGDIINALLDGAAPSSLELPERTRNNLSVDQRQTRRWRIADSDVPPDAYVEFKQPTFWDAYRTAALIGGGVMLLQAGLIGALLLEHRRRLKAEGTLVQRGSELAHASRLAIAGELTASIAHEINQPLAAILANTEAAELMVKSGTQKPDDIGNILADIRRDDLRASDVIARLRSLLAKHVAARHPIELNEAVDQGCAMVEGEARRRAINLVQRPGPSPMQILGDRIQIQQVLINLLLNAMDALGDLPDSRRTIVVSTARHPEHLTLSVSDRGHGIEPAHLPRLFDSFFSTKSRGMGLGLSISRSIVDAHGGRLRVDSTPGKGTVFHVDLPSPGIDGAAPKEYRWT
ncbi:sensor histidine kinase [Variovorax saccharolyticus]|uniref:sensor histidine kinase n=1 Tax=Variovorax saccharolyticus TaxID=3053516 RepID=UPI00257909E9|nr:MULTISPECIES: ATP-binding protein [unclassified Variovorax]MDM0022458.1 ATP-binding protein [Variovorax sp. J22R187]MDM0028222.1 ATP-binding protein [Variovorax sp. J31P216]